MTVEVKPQVSEIPRQLRLIGDLRRSVNFARSLNNVIQQNGSGGLEVELYDLKTVVDYDLLTAVKGIGSGIYQEMRNDGGEVIAKMIMLEEGIPQQITQLQRKYLKDYDKRYERKTT